MTENRKPGAERREVDYDRGQRKIHEYLESGRILRFIMNTPDADTSACLLDEIPSGGWGGKETTNSSKLVLHLH